MIWELIFAPIKALIYFVMSLFPDTIFETPAFDGLLDILAIGFQVVPATPINLAFGCILFWLEVNLVWGSILWILKKLPFISIS